LLIYFDIGVFFSLKNPLCILSALS